MSDNLSKCNFEKILNDVRKGLDDFKDCGEVKKKENINKYIFDTEYKSIKISKKLREFFIDYIDDCDHVYKLLYDDLEDYIENSKSLEYIKKKLGLPYTETTKKKKRYIFIANEIKEFMFSSGLVDYMLSQHMNNDVDDDDVLNYKLNNPVCKKIDLWENQLEAINHVLKNGFINGIHCQATGSGKSIIILKYCSLFNKQKKKGNIIIFTERCNIVADLFGFERNNLDKIDEKNKKKWKDNDIINLDQFEIINRVTVKDKNWVELIKDTKGKKKILVINRAYLTKPELYKQLNSKHIGLILHDECHNTTSRLCFNMLKYFKKKGTTLVGFSATPLRTGKIKIASGDHVDNIKRLIEIYGKIDNLTILTNYNMIYAIDKGLILPPKFYWYQMNERQDSEDIPKEDMGIIATILTTAMENAPYKKIVVWCGTIKNAEKWLEMFKKYHNLYPALTGFKFYIDHSQIFKSNKHVNDYDKFKKEDEKCILFCANKHREGSDIRKLDMCIFIDGVNNRGPVPFIQSIGRALRKCGETNDKKCGIVIDGLIRDSDKYEKIIIDKIIGYYLAFENLSVQRDNNDDKFKEYIKIKEIVKFDKENNIIEMKIGKAKFTINCSCVEWKNVIKKFDKVLVHDIIKLSENDYDQMYFKKIKNEIKYCRLKSDKEYSLYADKNNLPVDPKNKFKDLWKGWYDFLTIDTSNYPENAESWKKKCRVHNISTNEAYSKYCEKYGLPLYPKELYNIDDIDYELGDKIAKIMRR